MTATEPESLDVEAIRGDFPILSRTIGENTPLTYLDNAATTQTPTPVIDAMNEFHREYNANVDRGIHQLSMEASIEYEEAHDRIAEFVGATGRKEIVFTKNTTEAMNMVAQAWGREHLEPGRAVVLTEMDHHASLVPFTQIAGRMGAEVRHIPSDGDGRLDMEAAADLIDDDVEVVSVPHVSNTLGTVNPLRELADMAHEHDALILGDGAQAVPTRPVDVKSLDVDFYAFSGHKMAGPTGIGALYGRADLLEEMEPFQYGGGMIERVTLEGATWAEVPMKFEAGTPPIAEGIGFAAAADYLDHLGMREVQAHEAWVTQYAHEELRDRADVTVYGPPLGEERGALVSFTLDGVHPHDLSSILNEAGVAIRAGDHCTQPLHNALEIPASARASFYAYNTTAEVDVLLEGLDAARDLFA
ncbi:aminotransferase class V-fold PLP-dependent enzyme [Halodesulfurarchaeum sp.]|uniref:aminotransferase class V-fold PLP-dependent enzyme n=1 Tax=Halodesulfurarchaeum sp. TaxID=1980530 RepID=UPI001BBF0A62|nr:SufS family cysteine desulfurase [Halodesulfurarchaeum sp.]